MTHIPQSGDRVLQVCDAQSTLYITTEKVIVHLLKADRKKYLPLSRLYRFVAYLRQQLENEEILSPDARVIFDVSFDSIERTVQYNDLVYDLIDDKIFLKGVLPTIQDDSDLLARVARDFADKFAA